MTVDQIEIPLLLNQLGASLVEAIEQRQIENPIVIGIHSGGVWVAEKIHQCLKVKEPLGLLDISFYRDDFSQIGVNPKVKQSKLPLTVEGRDIILIDDVFYTGRTIRAALNEIFDYGRPRQVILGVLIERNGRQVPIRPDCIGAEINLIAGQRIKLTGSEPLGVVIQTVS
ncbi:pyrimidine operon attenuation protein/uracil phosphoribosyltransferase [Bathymodiolus platifrons methanotrophic gill symbiont]|uniref:bifunctional pyr operon transcriptional regulator/uracil phosphoribosyltransferase PyrR n=1 Tax=Bathymodiolus platifrons methanotrophic gill symbiont TaxID=113268 RepID=UPI000B419B36|nr:bifunctional pyr operon transcriptional regulator/uracil phosphoribosyltransferase PyrR [Bathymodiolus platifrons methanotrophic gill symbiont]MCK5869993.1 bifunctional pyr operon transcriptional regulator/uracil phosphoribosyltransferase PyrR [Methyloprofundus sp.]TXK93925.1 bifunctional pyr operon transcriptional regulator/uracil phosphoribosyltransferase [Methylococcaceae bacterium CS5]TXK94987.1 bifunctional pyr operon transcriptional regulator/uracil phosphoribosyltransferase [Methylococ